MINSDHVSFNLLNFYKRICSYPGFSQGEFGNVLWVRSDKQNWPEFTLEKEIITAESLQKINKAISQKEIPPFLIKREYDDDFEEDAWSYGIRKINYWKGMGLDNPSEKMILELPPGVSIDRFHTVDDLHVWVNIINSEIITGKSISPQTFLNVMNSSDFDFWKLEVSGQMISTLLIFRSGKITGIYMVSTIRKYRGKGYASLIVASALNYYIRKGLSKFVLHSTKDGFPLYRKLGFHEINEYGIYWKIDEIK